MASKAVSAEESGNIPRNIPAYFKAETVKGYLNIESKEQSLRWTQYTVTSRSKFKEKASEDVLEQPWSMVPYNKRVALINHVREAWPSEWDPNLASVITEWRVSQLHNKARKSKPPAGRASATTSVNTHSSSVNRSLDTRSGYKIPPTASAVEIKTSRYWDPIRDQDVELHNAADPSRG